MRSIPTSPPSIRSIPSLLSSEDASLTEYIVLPGRFADEPIPDWALKHVSQDMQKLASQLNARFDVLPYEVWRQICLNGDVEVMLASHVTSRLSGRGGGHLTEASSPSTGDSSTLTLWS